MARSFDGVDDQLLSPDNVVAGIDTQTKSVSLWCSRTGNPAALQAVFVALTADGAGNARFVLFHDAPAASGYRLYAFQNGTTFGAWRSTNDITNARHHLAITYDRGLTANTPLLYVDGVSVAVSLVQTPVAISTGEDTVKLGQSAGGTQDFAGAVSHAAFEGGQLWTAAMVNRAMWWGRPHGGLQVYHPLLTDKLVDEGSGAETLTATGTTVTNLVTPCVRPGSSMLGLNIGW